MPSANACHSGPLLNGNVGDIRAIFFDSSAKYNSFQSQIQVKGLRGFMGQASFTLGKCFDDGSGAQLGDPLGLNSSDPYDFPSRVKGCNPINSNFKQNGMNYLNLSCFTLPTPPSGYTGPCQPLSGIAGACQSLLGNNGRNQIYGPKLVEVDLSLIKNFRVQRVSERFGVEFRADAFNVLNHPNFLPPVANNVLGVTSTGSLTGISGAGQISQTATSSRQIQLAVKVIW